VIQVRGEWDGNLRGDCNEIRTGEYRWPSEFWVEVPEVATRFLGPPAMWDAPAVELINSAFRTAWLQWNEIPESRKPHTTVMATVIGRLDAVLPLQLDRFGNPAGFGHLNVYPARLVLIEVRDVKLAEVKRRVTPVPTFLRVHSAK
jgi:hypothetical protein